VSALGWRVSEVNEESSHVPATDYWTHVFMWSSMMYIPITFSLALNWLYIQVALIVYFHNFFKLQRSEVIAEDQNKNWFQENKIIFVL
jgi:hypothetical protein